MISYSRLRFALLLTCLAAADAAAQYRFDTWTTDNGLPQNGVREITQTPDGYLWFTTFDGLVRFDGLRFTTFGTGNTPGIINNRFTGLYRDGQGTLYATTMEDGILTVYRDGVFTSYGSADVPGHYIQRIAPDGQGELRFLVEDESRTTKSWYYLRDGKFVFAERDDPAAPVIVRAPDGAVWRVTNAEAVEERAGVTTRYRLDIGPLPYRPNLFADRAGHLWIGEYVVHRLGRGQVRTFAAADGLPRSVHHEFWEDEAGDVWFATGGGSLQGVGLVRHHDGVLQAFGAESGLQSPFIFSVFRDREDTTWVATNRGLARFRKQVLTARSIEEGLAHSEVYPLYRDRRNRIWVGTTRGVSIYQDGRFTPLEAQPAEPRTPPDETWRNAQMSVQSFWEEPDGAMWVGLNGGIYVIDEGRARMLTASKGHHVFAIRDDRHGNVWAATNKGLLQFRERVYARTWNVADGLPNEFMTLIFEDSKGQLWFGGFGGLSRFRDGAFTNYTTKEGLAGSYVRSIYEDADGVLWIGTYDEGLSRFKDGAFVTYKAEHGLSNNGVFAIQEDTTGHFWISSNRGIYRVRRQELNDFAAGKASRIHSIAYGTQDGMRSTECNGGRQPASIADAEGRFWFPTQDGVVIIDPEHERHNALPPSVVIESATVEREPVNISQGLVVEPGPKNIEINFTGISLIKSDQIRFRYRLEGHDAGWIDADRRRTAYYSYLPPGRYRFIVAAANSDDVWNEAGASLALHLKPYFYQTNAFYALTAVVLALMLFGAWKASVHQLQSRQQELARLVDAKTEELRRANEELQLLAKSDVLTGVANRRWFDEFLEQEWRRALRLQIPIALILIDIDQFKAFNDTYGHQAGDECLKQVAAALTSAVHRPSDMLARFGGEEFAIILGGSDLQGAVSVAEQARARVEQLAIPHRASSAGPHVTVSAGVAAVRVTRGMPESDLIKAADQALYRAKAGGRNSVAS